MNWDRVTELIKKKNINGVKSIVLSEAEKYKYDMDGLFTYLGVPKEYLYIHIRVNGYISSRCYDSNQTVFDMIDLSKMNSYKKMFKR